MHILYTYEYIFHYTEAKDFMIFTDKSSVVLASISDNVKLHRVIRGNPLFSSFTGLAVTKDAYYFSDLIRYKRKFT